MATISENLQIIADSTAAIKQAIINKGGDASGDITTWASAISSIQSGGGDEELDLITFAINNFNSCTRICPRGMTWTTYVTSVFNTRDMNLGNFIINQGLVVYGLSSVIDPQTGDRCRGEDIIVPQSYQLYQDSGGN